MQFFCTHLPPPMSPLSALERMQMFFSYFFFSNADSAPLSPLSAFERKIIYACVCRFFFRMQIVKKNKHAIFPQTLTPRMSPLSALEGFFFANVYRFILLFFLTLECQKNKACDFFFGMQIELISYPTPLLECQNNKACDFFF